MMQRSAVALLLVLFEIESSEIFLIVDTGIASCGFDAGSLRLYDSSCSASILWYFWSVPTMMLCLPSNLQRVEMARSARLTAEALTCLFFPFLDGWRCSPARTYLQ